jgi:hypothetical protein
VRIAYTKIGRSQAYDPGNWGVAGGDWEAPLLLNRLARFLPEVEFVIVGHSDGANPQVCGLPSNVTNPGANLRREVRQAENVINVRGTIPPENSIRYIEYMRKIWDPIMNQCDGLVAWVGQNDTINQPIPKVQGGDGLGSSRHIYIRHVSYLLSWVNAWREEDPAREPVWLCSDIWNTLKARDLKWPHRHPVICQYNLEPRTVHYRWRDPRGPEHCGFEDVAHWHNTHTGCWASTQRYEYAGLELGSCVPSNIELNDDWGGRRRFGVMVNQSREASGRDEVLRDWIKPLWPDWVVGSWDDERKQDLTIEPYPWHAVPSLLQTVRSTLLVPIKLQHSWATPKAWECFAAGVVAFMHPRYDSQGHILPTLRQCEVLEEAEGPNTLTHLARWLRCETVGQLRKRVDHLNAHPEDWAWIVKAQRALYNTTREENLCLRTIAQRLGIPDALTRAA